MDERIRRISKPRCFLVYALAPSHLPAREANRAFNEFIADPSLPLPVFHDHFIGRPGGIAVFFVEGASQRDALLGTRHLSGWDLDIRPLIFSYSPAAFESKLPSPSSPTGACIGTPSEVSEGPPTAIPPRNLRPPRNTTIEHRREISLPFADGQLVGNNPTRLMPGSAGSSLGWLGCSS